MSKSEEKSNRGRKSKYHTHIEPYLEHIAQMRRNGLTLDQIAERFKVSHESINQYKNKFPEFAECLKENAELAIVAVENALFKNATSGNLGAQIFFLKNRASKSWRDKQHIFQSGSSTTTVKRDYDSLTDEELEREMGIMDEIVPDDEIDIDGGGEVH
jgi:uncharacterized protein (DUF433 family)